MNVQDACLTEKILFLTMKYSAKGDVSERLEASHFAVVIVAACLSLSGPD